MARTVNKVILVGHCGGDPSITTLNNGNKVANVNLATNSEWKDRVSGEKKQRSEWHRIVFYGNLAEITQNYVKKGALLFIEGELRYSKVEGENGTRYYTDVICRELNILSSRNSTQGGNSQGYDQSQPDSTDISHSNAFEKDDDLPF